MRNNHYKYTTLCLAVCSILYSQYSLAEEYFDPNLIDGYGENNKFIDLSVFDQVGGQLPGQYYTSVYLNQNLLFTKNIPFVYLQGSQKLSPALTKKEYIDLGVLKDATKEFSDLANDTVINDIATVIPDAFFKYDFSKNRLDLSIPQIYLDKTAIGAVNEALWDDGLNALFTNYYYSGSTTKINGQSGTESNSYFNLRSGINMGAWRLRNYSTYNYSNSHGTWKTVNTYVERDIKPLKSQLTMGDTYTNSDMFDSFSFRGIKLVSDDSMLPSSQRGYAPIIRGVAQSNAEVTIKQNGVIIRQSYVPAGPFEFNDFYPTSTSGDLEVTIKEADGSTRTYIQPFSSVPIMIREGNFKYSIIAGKYRSNSVSNNKEPNFLQTTAIYGLPYASTVYGGSILSKDYKSVLLGLGKGLGEFGSVSFDAIIARSTLQDNTNTGSSIRFQYSKDVLASGTSFSFTSYRYSTKNYREFSDVNDYSYFDWQYNQNKKDKFQVNINQTLGQNFGYLTLTGYQERYWNKKGKVQSYQFGYTNNFNDISFFSNFSYSKSVSANSDSKLLTLSVSIPLTKFFPNANLFISTMRNDDHQLNNTVGLSGTALDDNSLNYNIQTSYVNNNDSHYSGSASVNYKMRTGEYQLGYNYNNHSSQLNYSTNGAVVIHPYGITLGHTLGDSSVLVRAKDAKYVNVENNPGIYTDYYGHALVPYASSYEKNTITLDTNSLTNNADILSNVKTVVPTKGAIVLANYPTQIGYKIYVKLTGNEIPFGATATLNNGENDVSGIIDDGQVVFLSGAPAKGNIEVKWSSGQCTASYQLTNLNADIHSLSATCN